MREKRQIFLKGLQIIYGDATSLLQVVGVEECNLTLSVQARINNSVLMNCHVLTASCDTGTL